MQQGLSASGRSPRSSAVLLIEYIFRRPDGMGYYYISIDSPDIIVRAGIRAWHPIATFICPSNHPRQILHALCGTLYLPAEPWSWNG